MRLLILSSNNGGGHNAVAKAIQESFEAHGDLCQVRDCLSFISSGVSQTVARSHNFVYRHAPELFGSGYQRSEQNTALFREHHNARRLLDLGVDDLALFLIEGQFDTVLCTHVFAAIMLTDAMRKYGLLPVTGIVETDYTNTPGSNAGDLDMHFVPTETLRQELIARGVAEERVTVSGIPVRGDFYRSLGRGEAKRHAGVDPAHRHLLVMCGSMGCGPVPRLVEQLACGMDGETEVSVVCGSNRSMLRALRGEYAGAERIHIYGLVDKVPLLMDSADALLTKPGGISTTEAAVKRLPMVLMNTVSGCEEYNLSFFVRAGGAVAEETVDELSDACLGLLRDEDGRLRMAAALDKIAAENDREIVYTTMNRLYRERRGTWTA